MAEESLVIKALVSGLDTQALGRYTYMSAYIVCFYDWILLLDQEVAYIYPASWNVVKAAYIFCRYYPLATASFQLWGFLGDHEQSVCESYYHAIYASIIPTMLSAQFILMLRTYAFSGRKRVILAVLSITLLGLAGVIIWVTSTQLILSPLFLFSGRSGCFAISDLGAFDATQGISSVQVPIAYHLGLISILTTSFDFLNLSIVVRQCVRRGTFGPLGQSFLKQGMFVYIVMMALNALTIGTFLSPYLVVHGLGLVASFAYILPSTLACRLVLMLRRAASPTETDLRVEHSHMINEAIEMVALEWHHGETSEGFAPSISTEDQA